MTEINTLEQMRQIIEGENLVLFYLSRPACGVCTVLKEKITALCRRYPTLKSYTINLDRDERVAGQFSVFTIPGILVFTDGKETIREARYISIEQVQRQLDRLTVFLKS